MKTRTQPRAGWALKVAHSSFTLQKKSREEEEKAVEEHGARQTDNQAVAGRSWRQNPPKRKVRHNRNSPQPDTGLRSGQEDEEHGKALCCLVDHRDRGATVLTSSSQRNATICRCIAPQSRSSTPRVPPGHKHCAAGNKATSPKRTCVEHHRGLAELVLESSHHTTSFPTLSPTANNLPTQPPASRVCHNSAFHPKSTREPHA